jgi:hypothetical protein
MCRFLVGWIDDTPDAIREQDLRSWVDGGTLEFLGKLDDVRPALAAASVYVLPSTAKERRERSWRRWQWAVLL